jgi:hypothetical protein
MITAATSCIFASLIGKPIPFDTEDPMARGSPYCNITCSGTGAIAISAISLLRIAFANELKFSATITNAPGPPITLSR